MDDTQRERHTAADHGRWREVLGLLGLVDLDGFSLVDALLADHDKRVAELDVGKQLTAEILHELRRGLSERVGHLVVAGDHNNITVGYDCLDVPVKDRVVVERVVALS